MLWEISGTENAMIIYHGKSMGELMSILPKWPGSNQLSPEAMLWFLYTATIPSRAELIQFTQELVRRAVLPTDVQTVCDVVPSELPPDAQLVMALSAYSHRSKFKVALQRGVPKTELWRYALDDALDSAGAVPMIVARLYMKKYGGGRAAARSAPIDPSGDLARNFAIQMGRGADTEFTELIRLYWATHFDHGANISAHCMRKFCLHSSKSHSVWGRRTQGPLMLIIIHSRSKQFSVDRSLLHHGLWNARGHRLPARRRDRTKRALCAKYGKHVGTRSFSKRHRCTCPIDSCSWADRARLRACTPAACRPTTSADHAIRNEQLATERRRPK